MKKIIHIAFATILAGLAISCQKEEVVSDKTDVVQYTFNITVNDRVGFDDDASTKGNATYKTRWENGDRIFLFFKPTSGNLLTDTHATLTYNEGSWSGSVTGLSSLGKGGNLSAVYVYKLKNSVTPVFSDSKWTIATGNTFYSCRTEVPYTVSGNNEISASLSLETPADFVQFYVEGATGVLTCNQVKGWKDVAIGSDLTVSNITCTLYMMGSPNSGDSEVREYYGRIVNDGKSLKGVACEFSVANNGTVYERTTTPTTEARSFKMNIITTGDKKWTKAPDKLPGLFTVGIGADGKAGTADDVQVRFSKGNLVAAIDASGNPIDWKFAEKQYDYLGTGGANTSIGTAAGDIDLFGWSTDSTIYGINTSTSKYDYSGAFKDWGKALSASTSIAEDTWRTLTINEWEYLINEGGIDNVRKGKYKFGVTVSGKTNCLILVPDNIEMDIKASYDGTLWTVCQLFGLVCLPAAGYRNGSNVSNVDNDNTNYKFGYYWSSDALGDDDAFFVKFLGDRVTPSNADKRFEGRSVRLVTELK